MAAINDFYLWSDEHNKLQNIREYDHLTEEFDRIRSRVLSTNTFSNADERTIKNNIVNHYKRIISDGCTTLRKKIDYRKTRGQLFFDNKKQIKQILAENENEQELEKCQDNLGKLQEITARVEEKISVEIYTLLLFIIGLIIGFFLCKIYI